MSDSGDLTQVSHEVDGRILTGVGVSADDLAETMERHSPDGETVAPVESVTSPAAGPPSAGDVAAKPSRGQRRFDELTREREDARREADAARRERDELRARLEHQSQRVEPARAVEHALSSPSSGAAPSTRPKPTEDEIGAKYQSYGDFVEDLADWKAEQRLAGLDLGAHVRGVLEAERASTQFTSTVEQTFVKGRELFPDFDRTRTTGPGATVNFSGPKIQAILSLPPDLSAKVQYAISRDAGVAQHLSSLSDAMFGYELARIAPQASASPASPSAGSPSVPAPYSPVGSGTRTAAASASELVKAHGYDFDKSGYREKRARELGRKR